MAETASVLSERIRIGDEYYLLASAVAPRRPRLLLNHADSFGIFDSGGDVPLAVEDSYGLFHRGTRFLDRFEFRLNSDFPVLLASSLSDDGSELCTHLTNPDERRGDEVLLVRDTVYIRRSKTLLGDTLYERIQVHNYGSSGLRVELTWTFDSDFADVFELRGMKRSRRGSTREPAVERNSVRLWYEGLDHVTRQTVLNFSPKPDELTGNSASFRVELNPGADVALEIQVRCAVDSRKGIRRTFAGALSEVSDRRREWSANFTDLYSNNEGFNDWLNRSVHDLGLLLFEGSHGACAYAGIPWFATLFGRDSMITALETLAFAPELAAGTLRTLAAMQGHETNPARDEEPGKILHEMRHGEMAATGEVPFGRYYGSVDSTPLFLVLLAEYADRTADLALVGELWPAAAAAMGWIDDCADLDGDGYVEYARRNEKGLINQGWKDSHDAISHTDGSLAEAPIALAEVQAYVYAARTGAARLARRLGRSADAERWEKQAAELRVRFNRDFWIEKEQTFAIALDGGKRPCAVVSSNAGHCLFGGIVDPGRANAIAERLMREDMFCGWGLRTLSSQERRYNPMSYHNGSVWPHDNALIAAGFARYGNSFDAGHLLTALFDASLTIQDRRLPELFCGFARREQHQPVPYPVACSPQAWAAGSVFLILQSMLGLGIDAWERRVVLNRPSLPTWLERLEIRRLRVRDACLDLAISRGRRSASVEIIERQGDVQVAVLK